MKKIFLISVIASSLICSEVSVFDAGNLDIKNPYGLTSAEKHIAKNKQEIQSVETRVNNLKVKVDDIGVKFDGVASVVESNNDKVNELSMKNVELTKKIDVQNSEISILKSNIESLRVYLEQTNKTYNDNTNVLKSLISDLSKAVSEINKNYVSTKEFKTNLEQLANMKKEALKLEQAQNSDATLPKETATSKKENTKKQKNIENKAETKNPEIPKETKVAETKKEVVETAPTSSEKTNGNTFARKSTKEIFELSKKFMISKEYDKAIEGFNLMIDKNYKAAESNYQIGLAKFEQKEYEGAIDSFRKSAILNDNATYMPNLLLKSAESFEATNNEKNAKKFYSALSESYPKSKEAETANKKLKKLK